MSSFTAIVCIASLSVVIIKIIQKYIWAWDNSPTCLVGKTAIVTGANSGIGFYTAQDFAKRGARVVLACRDPHRAEEARRKIIEATDNQNVIVRILDLSSLASVREFATTINTTEARLDILVNNAGISFIEHTVTSDGLSLLMQSNHFGPFLLTILLLDLLKRSAPSRIVMVSSNLAYLAKLDLNDLNAPETGIFSSRDYCNSNNNNNTFHAIPFRGIGFYTAKDFAMRGAKVILACRNKEKAQKARRKIIEDTNNYNVFVKLVDLASLKSVRDFAQDIIANETRLDILVNNAGVGYLGNSVSTDGLVELLQVNYFGPFLLTNLLISLLKKSAPSRIVNVSSSAHLIANLDPDDLNVQHLTRNYGNSKLLNILFSCELSRKLEGTGVVSNSLHPGLINTEIFQNVPLLIKSIVKILSPILSRTAEEGAQTSIYLSVSKNVDNASGKYFQNCQESKLPKIALNLGFTKKVWKKTEELVNLKVEGT